MSGYAEQQPVSAPPVTTAEPAVSLSPTPQEQEHGQEVEENEGGVGQDAESAPCSARAREEGEGGDGNPGEKSDGDTGGDVDVEGTRSEQSAREVEAGEEERPVAGAGGPVGSSGERPEGGGEGGSASVSATTGNDGDDSIGDGGGGDEVSTATAAAVALEVRHAGEVGVRGRLTQAGQKARKGILGALMPAAACLVDDPAAEVRGTTAVTLGEMLRLMVGFEDYVATLGSSARKPAPAAAPLPHAGVGVSDGAPVGTGHGVGATGGESGEGVTTVVARGVTDRDGVSCSTGIYGGGSMETCCCVIGQDEDGDVDEVADGAVGSDTAGVAGGRRVEGDGGSVGPRRRVCHGRVMQAAMAAAAAAADAVAEAAMTAELIDLDLAGFEGMGDEDEEASGGIGLAAREDGSEAAFAGQHQHQPEEQGVIGGLPFAKHDDVEALEEDSVSLCGSTAVVEGGVERGEDASCADVETRAAQETPAGQDSSEERSRDDRPAALPPAPDSGDAPAEAEAEAEAEAIAGPEDEDEASARASQHGGGTSRDDARPAGTSEHVPDGGDATAAAEPNALEPQRAVLEFEDDEDDDEDGSVDSNGAVNGRDDLGGDPEEALPAGSSAAATAAAVAAAADAAGDAVVVDSNTGVVGSNNDPLIVLVTRLLLDADANVACTMLQALRPGWVPELGPGPGPKHCGSNGSGRSSSSPGDEAPPESECAAPAAAGVDVDVDATETEAESGSPGGSDGKKWQGEGDCQMGAGESDGGGEFQEAAVGQGSGGGGGGGGSGGAPVPRRSCLLTPAQVMEHICRVSPPPLKNRVNTCLWTVLSR